MCTIQRIPFLIEALDILPSGIEFEENDGFYFASINFYCVAPEAYINGMIFSMLAHETPSISYVPCLKCGKPVMVLTSQQEEFTTENPEKYNKFTFPYCSKDCQLTHIQKFKGAKSLAFGSLKNHECALVIHGADTTKRLKEKEVHLIVGNDGEQRARCLKYELEAISPRQKKKYLTSKEVKLFFLNEVDDDLKISSSNAHRDTYRIMNKCKELFPDSILIGRLNQKTRYIQLI